MRGDTEWNPWWRTTILIKSDVILVIPSPYETQPTQTTGYLWAALQKGLTQGVEILGSVGGLTEAFAHALPALQAAPDGAYIMSHNRKILSNQLTNFIISLPDPAAYAILTTLDSFIKILLPTLITVRGQPHPHMVNINITPHMRIILGPDYQQLLTNLKITTLNPQTTPLRYITAKGLQGKRKDKITWSHTLSQYPEIFANYEAQLSSAAKDETPDRSGAHNPPQRQHPPNSYQQHTPHTR